MHERVLPVRPDPPPSRQLPAGPSTVTVIKDAAGREFASLVVTTTDEPLPPAGSEVGIDLGLTHFTVLPDGTKVTTPKFLRRAARKLKRLQQDLSRKQRGSMNRTKAVVKVAKAHARVAETRKAAHGRTFARIGRFVSTSQTCSVRPAGWAQAADRPVVDLPVRRGPRPGRQRGRNVLAQGTLGEPERPVERR